MAELSRRSFLALGATLIVGACSSGDDDSSPTSSASSAPSTAGGDAAATTATAAAPATTEPTTPEPTTGSTAPELADTASTVNALAADPFVLGVSSGDPDETSVVLWTRLVGDALPEGVPVAWELSAEESFATVGSSGAVTASAADAHSVHVVAELDGPSWYRFRAGGFTSPAGRAAPLPAAGASTGLRMATATCQHWETGYYAAHRDIVEWAPDLVLFLGDFIYEGAGQPVGDDRVRSHDGPEPMDLPAYRSRYAQYLSDADLRASRAVAPWLVIWDDHEVENNYAGVTPQDPADAAGFAARRAAAYRAWWEHMPVRLPAPVDGADYVIYRSLRWGDLADVILLDGRQFRSDQACGDATLSVDPACPEAADPARTMLGAEQEAWLGETLAAASGTWTVLGQQTVLTDLELPNSAVLNYDQWDGYGPARDRLLAQAATADRVVVLTGDIHLAGVGLLPGVGVEFVTTSVSSSGDIPATVQPLLAGFDTIVDAELAHRGYVRHTVTPDEWAADFRIVDDVADPASGVSTWHTFRLDAASPQLPTTE